MFNTSLLRGYMKEVIIKATMILLAILAPAKAMLITALTLIMIDLITGVIAARKRGEPITSAGLGRSISKLLVYELALVIGFITQTYMLPEVPVASIISGYIGLTECTSCLENINEISGNNLLKSIVDKLSSKNTPPT